MKSKHGQSGTEAIISLGIILVCFFIILIFYVQKSGNLETERVILTELHECQKLANVISNVYTSSDGTLIEIFLRKNAAVFPDSQRIEVGDNFCTFPVNTINNGITNGDFNLTSGKIKIENKKGVVVVSMI
jgi:hypothetical protein